MRVNATPQPRQASSGADSFSGACGRAAVALASCAPQCESSSIMPGSECDGTSWVHVSDPGDGKNLNRAREPSQQCLSAKLLDVSAILGSGLMIQHKDARPISCAINLTHTHLCDPHLPVLYYEQVCNRRVKVQHKNTIYSMYILYTHIDAHNA